MKLANRGVSGERSPQTAAKVIGTQGTAYRPGSEGIVALMCAINDERRSNLPAAHAEFQSSLKSVIATARATSRIEANTAGSFTGAWTTGQVYTPASGGVTACTTAQGAYVDIGFFGSEVTLLMQADPVLSFTAEISIDGAVVRTRTTNNEGLGLVVVAPTIAEHFTGLTPGAHTMRIRKTDAAGTSMAVDCLLPVTENPPLVMVVREGPLANWAPAGSAPFDQGSDAAQASYWADMDTVITDYPQTVLVTLPTWDKSTMLAADQIHPNDAGHINIADAVEAAIRSRVVLPAGVGCSLSKSVDQMIPAAVNTAVVWDVEDFNDIGMHSTTVNPERVTITRAGVYLFSCSVSTSATVTGRFAISMYKNGSATSGAFVKGSRGEGYSNASYPAPTFTFPVKCEVGDFFAIYLFTATAAPADSSVCGFSAIRLG